MKIYLIRHGKTEGNLKKRYIGTTDEPLCEQGMAELENKKKPPVPELLYVSPLLRCRMTAAILYPGVKQIIVPDFRECDFGEFENKNYQELSGNENYQKWIDSMGTLPFPQGERKEDFSHRCVNAFYQTVRIAKEQRASCIAMVVHGGTIMSILEQAALPAKTYYEFQVKNGCGFILEPLTQDTEEKFFSYRTYG